MKTFVVLTVFLLAFQYCFAQSKSLAADSDTVFWYKYYKKLMHDFDLEDTKNNKSEFLFRFWDGSRVIELVKHKKEIQAIAVFFLRQYSENQDEKLHFKLQKLSKETAAWIYALVSKYNLITLPPDKHISGWEQGKGGLTCIIEFSDEKNYSFKSYWDPYAQKDLKEAKLVLGFQSEVDQIDELKAKSKKFMDNQPFVKWYKYISGGEVVGKKIR